MEDLLQ
jgi:hypothetical protein